MELRPNDLVAIIAFDAKPATALRMTRASQRMRISNDVARIHGGQAGPVAPAIQAAVDVLGETQSPGRIVVIGRTSRLAPALARQLADADIEVELVDLGARTYHVLRMR